MSERRSVGAEVWIMDAFKKSGRWLICRDEIVTKMEELGSPIFYSFVVDAAFARLCDQGKLRKVMEMSTLDPAIGYRLPPSGGWPSGISTTRLEPLR